MKGRKRKNSSKNIYKTKRTKGENNKKSESQVNIRERNLVCKWMMLTGRKIKNSRSFWGDLKNYVSEKEQTIQKSEDTRSKLEALLSASQDEVLELEEAVLEVSSVQDDLLDQFKNLQVENQTLKQEMSNQQTKTGVRSKDEAKLIKQTAKRNQEQLSNQNLIEHEYFWIFNVYWD